MMRGLITNNANAIAIFFLAMATVAIRAIGWGDPASDFDEQLYSLIGQQMLQGQWPYVDLWDRKPFGLFAIFAFAHATGWSGPEAYQALAGVCAFVTAVLTYAIANRMTGKLTAFSVTLLMLVLLSVYGAGSGQSEVFLLPLMLGMVWMLRDPRDSSFEQRTLMAMLLGGFALQVKYTVLPQCLALGLYALFHHWRSGMSVWGLIAQSVCFAALGIVPTALVYLAYVLLGGGDAWIFANLDSFFLREAARHGRFAPHVVAYGSACIALMLGGYYAAVRIIGPDDTQTYQLVVLWALSCLVTVLLPGSTYYYYYAALVPAACLVAVPLLDARGPGKWYSAIALVLIAIGFFRPDTRYQETQDRIAAVQRLSDAIAPLVDQDAACLWVHDGPTALYSTTRSCLPGRVIYPDHLNNALEAEALPVNPAEEAARILRTRPAVIVTANRTVSQPNEHVAALVSDALVEHYRTLHTETINDREVKAWALR